MVSSCRRSRDGHGGQGGEDSNQKRANLLSMFRAGDSDHTGVAEDHRNREKLCYGRGSFKLTYGTKTAGTIHEQAGPFGGKWYIKEGRGKRVKRGKSDSYGQRSK